MSAGLLVLQCYICTVSNACGRWPGQSRDGVWQPVLSPAEGAVHARCGQRPWLTVDPGVRGAELQQH